jgi:hypothetical protein
MLDWDIVRPILRLQNISHARSLGLFFQQRLRRRGLESDDPQTVRQKIDEGLDPRWKQS